MGFCTFSKDANGTYTVVDNQFFIKYLPELDGFTVKIYLYGLYLCANGGDFDLAALAEVFKKTEEEVKDAFALLEEYDLVEIVSQSPFSVQYLPLRASAGKPKKIRYEKYADFNKELQRKMQKVGKFISADEYKKYMRFLEENAMQPQAFLLIAEYCINKQGESVTPSYLFNKAKKLITHGYVTYERVERALSNYNEHEGDLIAVFNAMSVYQRTPDDTDYAAYARWTEGLGFAKEGILTAAKRLKKGSMTALDLTLTELAEKGKLTGKEIESYLTERETLANLTFRLGRKLGVKVQNPAPYIDEYTQKWYEYGFEESSLLDLALFCLKTERSDFESMHALVKSLFKQGIISPDGVKAFLKERNAELKLFAKIQAACGARKNENNLSFIGVWKEWRFSDEMIIEAAKRSAASASPIAYMNKILSDWKQSEIFETEKIPVGGNSTGAGTASKGKTPVYGGYTNPAIEAANAKAERERYYSLLRENAQSRADKAWKKANGNARFKTVCAELSKMEHALAKAELFQPQTLPSLQKKQGELLAEKISLLGEMGIDERELSPQYVCAKCQDTGFLASGAACDCYKK